MTEFQGNIRAIVAAAVAGLAVYSYSIQPATVQDRFAQIVYADKNALWSNQWFGIPTWQNPNDAWIIQEIISETKPEFIVETGTFRGGSAVLWATILREVNAAGRVITIDIEDMSDRARNLEISRMITFIIGSSTDKKVVSHIADLTRGKRVLVILDSNHSRDHVLNELKSYSEMVSVGSYIVVQDSNVNGHPVYSNHGPGPMEAIEAFLASNENFAPDRERERLMHTTNPKGYLKRLR